MSQLFIVGSRGIPAAYGGFETFAEELSTRLAARNQTVSVTCEQTSEDADRPDTYQGVNLLHVPTPDHALRPILADLIALWTCYHRGEPGDVVYLLGYGVGPFAWPLLKGLHAKEIEVWLNPDGVEWRRSHWSWGARLYLRFCSWLLPRHVDRLICDSTAIRARHLQNEGVDASHADVIEYGAPIVQTDDLTPSVRARRDQYLRQHDLSLGEYYIQVGRLVPENNLKLMIRAVSDPRVSRPLLIIANRDSHNGYYQTLRTLAADRGASEQVVFGGTVYDQPFLQALRLGAYAHLHGHEVGGTNPALVEAMGLGSLILALNTRFNREVLGRAGLYFGKSVEGLVRRLQLADRFSDTTIQEHQRRAVERVRSHYNWPRIVDAYERRIWDTATRPRPAPEPGPRRNAIRLDEPDGR
ncbi:DUF1972 domain-containing protein [Salinibacter ruber]|uniref:DUF1972 domain-containing protein n=1 Tax=Salinibacter ruber TaxID=146919 RepID=UPI002169BC68|nr:DUF1972 domain-containing protein [Salinibacter ruber]MCS3634717.1 rhamnosyltransferase [Salinibacter ruber]MCS3714207.1 rhamnosyltransferase [Salinibacter ruber]MCS4133406.1 rhamnosyltransferase [Salinibacter ruber]